MPDRLARLVATLADNAERLFASALMLLAIAGLIHVELGTWRIGPGVGNHLVPQLAYWVLLIAAAVMLLQARRNGGPAAVGSFWVMALGLAAGALYFMAVLRLGIAAASVLFIGGLCLLLTREPPRVWPGIVAVALIGAGLLWFLFTHVAPIVLRRPLLF